MTNETFLGVIDNSILDTLRFEQQRTGPDAVNNTTILAASRHFPHRFPTKCPLLVSVSYHCELTHNPDTDFQTVFAEIHTNVALPDAAAKVPTYFVIYPRSATITDV